MESESLLVTGGLGFLGSSFLKSVIGPDRRVANVDSDTYAGDERRVRNLGGPVTQWRMDIADEGIVSLVERLRPQVIVHFAAESHVTRSESNPERFFRTNVEGTRQLLRAAERSGVGLFLHISTDEVYGPCPGKPFAEGDKLPGEGLATSPYAQSKALADDVVTAFANRVPLVVARPTNCFGPWQHPEKAIPRWIIRALTGQEIPVWGDGLQVRDWMYMEDMCVALHTLLDKATPGEIYNIAPGVSHMTNLSMAKNIAQLSGRDEGAVRLTAYDRPQHDNRYAVDTHKIRALGWEVTKPLETRVAQTVDWYRSNENWWKTLVQEAETLYADDETRTAAAC
jgi:dTDP-glucose 4,6-dehydratase